MWIENYDTYYLLFADEGKVLVNKATKQIVKRVRCAPDAVKNWYVRSE